MAGVSRRRAVRRRSSTFGNNKAHRVMLGRPAERGRLADDEHARGDRSGRTAVSARRRIDQCGSRAAASRCSGRSFRGWFEGGSAVRHVRLSMWVIAVVPCGMLLGWQSWQWIAVSLGAAIVSTLGLLAWLWPIARRHSGEQFRADSATCGRCAPGVAHGAGSGPRARASARPRHW